MNRENQFATILTQLAGVTTGYRVMDLTSAPTLLQAVYPTMDAANAITIDKKLVLNGAMPWRVWYIAYDGAKLLREFENMKEARDFIAITPVQLRLSGPCPLRYVEPLSD